MTSTNRVNLGHSTLTSNKYNDDEEEFASLEPFFFDEEEAVQDHERKMQRLQEEERRKEQRDRDLKVHNAAMDKIREYDHKRGCTYFTRINFVNLSKFNLDEESPLDPMRETNASIDVHGTVCKEVRKQFIGGEFADIEKRFVPCISANVLSVKIASSDVGFPINVYGTVIARDDLDLKCVYLFQRDRDHCQLIVPKDTSLILTGPKRGLALIDGIYFEVDLKIRCDWGHKDKQFSKGLITLDGRKSRSEKEFMVERVSLDSRLSKVVLTYAVVKHAIEATIAIEVLQGRFSGSITACTTSIRKNIILYDSKLVKVMSSNAEGDIQLLRRVVAVCWKEKLIVTVAARNGDKSTVKFTPRVNGGDENEVSCGSIKMRVKLKGCGRRDYRGGDFRDRFDRRHSPDRDSRDHRSLHDRRPNSQERESSYSRTPSRKSERRHEKKPDDGETNSSRSLSVSDNNDDRKKDTLLSGDDKEDHELQLKQIRQDMELLRDDKSHLEIILDEKNAEVRKISSRVNDLDLQIRKEKEECHRMTSKMKKFIKAHARFLKAQEELKRSQARFERLGDLLASDILKRGANEEVSSINVDEDPNGPYERSPNAATAKKRSIPYSTSEEAKAVKKRRERDSDTTRPDKYRSEGTIAEFEKPSKGTEPTKSLYLKKKLWEDEKDKIGNFVSSANTDKVKESPVKHVLPSTGMAAHAVDDLFEAIELEDRHDPINASIENDADDETRSPVMTQQPPPVVNSYEQYEADDEEVDVD